MLKYLHTYWLTLLGENSCSTNTDVGRNTAHPFLRILADVIAIFNGQINSSSELARTLVIALLIFGAKMTIHPAIDSLNYDVPFSWTIIPNSIFMISKGIIANLLINQLKSKWDLYYLLTKSSRWRVECRN